MFKLYWGAAIIALPFFFMPQHVVDVRTHQGLFFWFLCFVSLTMFGISEPRHCPRIWASAIILSAGAFLIQLGVGDSLHPYVWFQWVSIGLAAAVAVQMTATFTIEDEKTLINAMAVTAILQSAWIVANVMNIEPYGEALQLISKRYQALQIANEKWTLSMPKVPITGSLGQETYSAALLGMTLPTLMRGKWWIFVPGVLFALYSLESAMGWGTAAVSATAFICLQRRLPMRRLMCAILVLGALAAALIWHGGFFSDSVRFHAWGEILKLHTTKTMLLGGGPGWLETQNLRIGLNRWTPSHNEYLEIFNIWGLLGLSAFGLGLSALWQRRENFYQMPSVGAVFLGLMANSLGHFPMHISATAVIGMVSFTLLTLPKGEKSYGRIYH